MIEFKGKTFQGLYDNVPGGLIADSHFEKCTFESCVLSNTKDPKFRTKINNVRLINCSARGVLIGAAILSQVEVKGLKTSGLLQLWGAALTNVVISGKVGRIMFSSSLMTGTADHQTQSLFNEANKEFYSKNNMALDISEGEFEECEIQGIPVSLIRRDPETQVVLTRAKALDANWRKLDLSGTHWPTSIDFMLERGEDAVVLVAGKRARNFSRLKEGINVLRKAGFVE